MLDAMNEGDTRIKVAIPQAMMDTAHDPRFDALTRLAARTLNMPMALITMMDNERVWCKSSVGAIPYGAASRREDSFGSHTTAAPGRELVVNDIARDPRFVMNPFVAGPPGLRFYAGIALETEDRQVLGTLCVMDTVPRTLAPDEMNILRDLACAANAAIELHRNVIELREAEANYRTAMELNPQIPWTADPSGGDVQWSSALAGAIGFTPDPATRTGWSDVLHPDEIADVESRWAHAIQTGMPMDFEHRLRLRDGHYRWFRSYAAPRRGPDGAILRWYGTLEDVTDRRATQAEIARLAYHDSLTGLPNRAHFKDIIAQRLRHAAQDRPVALLLVDLDNFKLVNDTYGHPAGDVLLRAVADRIAGCVRMPDVAARLGGDEFAIVITLDPSPPDPAAAASRMARRIIDTLTAPLDLNGHLYTPRASIGVAIEADSGAEPGTLQRNADLALYRAKNEGRNGFRLFLPEMDQIERARNALKLDLDHAIQQGEFELAFQPIIDLKDNRVRSFEALLRWRHPLLGVIAPQEFLAVAEQTGLIVPIGAWAMRQACQVAVAWPAEIGVAVNLSAVQFRDRDLIRIVTRALQISGLAPSRLELEITETMLMLGDETDLTILSDLHALGVRVALDDFGTGYSSLSYLHRFRFDTLKIDRSFISRAKGNEDHRAIIRAITSMSRAMAIATVGEGVETMEQFELLRDVGCDQAQGYLLSRPIAASEVTRLLPGFASAQWLR